MPKDKLNLGVGFYNNTYTQFSTNGNNNAWFNIEYWENGGSGSPNMRAKIDYIRNQQCGGIFIWEIMQDNLCPPSESSCYSLLDYINYHTKKSWGNPSPTANPCDVTPLILLSFTGQPQHNAALLKWVTSSEIDHSHFIIEASSNGEYFNEIATIQGKGTPQTETFYQYTDSNISPYYRLAMISTDGEISHSSIISMPENSILAPPFPNPFYDQITIMTPAAADGKPGNLRVFNSSGIEVYSQSITASSKLHLGESWPAGMYIIQILIDDKIHSYKVIKNH
ncbi:MAG: T9SS type A sorting domain-containing protein [Cytophagaceae bacterium]